METNRSTIQTGRCAMHVRDGGTGFPLVLLHGWPQNGYAWEATLPHLERFRCVRPDLRGLGDSERTPAVEAYTKAELAQDVIALLERMGIERFGLAGHDWGGAVAQEIAVAVPERVARLCLMNILLVNNPAGYRAAEARHARSRYRANWYQVFQQRPGLPEALIPGSEEAWLMQFLRGKEADWRFPEDAVAEYVRCYKIPGTPGTGANYYRAMRTDAARWKALAGHVFPMPTLLLYGEHDPVIVPEYLEGHEAGFADVRVQWLDASHFVPEEAPDAVGRALAGFFAPLA